MEQELISKLKHKPIPKSIESFEILLKQPEDTEYKDVKIKTVIVDKTREAEIDRTAFLNTLDLDVKAKNLAKDEFSLLDKKIEIQEDEDKTDKKHKKTKKDLDIFREKIDDMPMILNIKFTGVKFLIVKENIDVDIDAVVDTTEYTKKTYYS